VGTDVGGAVNPAVRTGVLISSLAHNGSAIKMILQEDEEQTEHDHERGGLVMEPEERVVYGELVPLEPLQQVADDRQSVGDCRRRHFVVLLVS